MQEASFCSSCGSQLTPGVSKGLCARCLLKRGMETPTAGFEETGKPAPRWEPPALADLAGQFAGLEVIELLGRGGMGAVYKARQTQLDRIVALKILPPDIGNDPAFAERFTREAKALARLNHPNVVTLYEFGRTDAKLYYFLMEYVDGVNLRRLMEGGRVAPREALAIVPQVCDALQYAHDQGIVHRDIKPENILLDRRGNVKVADFGLAKIAGPKEAQPDRGAILGAAALTEAGKVVGTPQYMAPEQATSPNNVDHRADIYALGVVFYQMLTGELPGRPVEAPSHVIHVDVRLDEVVLRALERDPALRYAQASVMKTDVQAMARMPLPIQQESAAGLHPRLRQAASRVRAPGIALIAVAGIEFVDTVFQAVRLPTLANGSLSIRHVIYILAILAACIFVAWGGNLMRRMKGFEAGIMAATVILLCAIRLHGLWWLGVPVAVWAFVALFESRQAFGTDDEAPPPMPRGAMRSLYPPRRFLGFTAYVFAWLSGLIPTLFFWLAPWLFPSLSPHAKDLALWTTLVAALLAIGFGLASRWSSWGRQAMVIGGINLAIWLICFAFLHVQLHTAQVVVSPYPQSEFLTHGNNSALIVHDNVDLHYAICCNGHFEEQTPPEPLAASPTWVEQGLLKLRHGPIFAYLRKYNDPSHLIIDGQIFDLRRSRVLRLNQDGSVDQIIRAFPDLAEACQVDALALSATVLGGTINRLPPSIRLLENQLAEAGERLGDLDQQSDPDHSASNNLQQLVNELKKKVRDTNQRVQTRVFGTVIVRLLAFDRDFLTFATGAVAALPRENDLDKAKDWIEQHGDTFAQKTDAGPVLRGRKYSEPLAEFVRVKTDRWNTITPDEVLNDLATSAPDNASEDHLASTYLFRTRNNEVGVVQWIGAMNDQIELRYRMVEYPRQQSVAPNPSDEIGDAVDQKIDKTTAAKAAETPQLPYLGWQEENEDFKRWNIWSADGSLVTKPSELKLFDAVNPSSCTVTGIPDGHRDPHFLYMWFSHPLFDPQSINEVSWLDAAGQPVRLAPADIQGGQGYLPSQDDGNIGWLTHTLHVGDGADVPESASFRLTYSAGPWKQIKEFRPPDPANTPLGGGVQFNGIFKDPAAGFMLNITAPLYTNAFRGHGIIAVTKDGRILNPVSVTNDGAVDGNFSTDFYHFGFEAKVETIDHFWLCTRETRTIEFNNIKLPKLNPSAASDPDRRIAIGDRLRVMVWDQNGPDTLTVGPPGASSMATLEVDDKGQITLPDIPPVTVKALTAREAEAAIIKACTESHRLNRANAYVRWKNAK